ncbi:hypothetical protein [Cohnella boryungensis]|uniref:Uncharacterized protein n=1 Tax=Cohnella boryungensis TaxID=768479 RepID=A0ABV8SHN7_9BACL
MIISLKTDDGLLLEVRGKERGRVRLKLRGDYNRAKFIVYCLEFISANPEYQQFYVEGDNFSRDQLINALKTEFKTNDSALLEDVLQVAEKVLVRLQEHEEMEEQTDVASLIPISSEALRTVLLGRFGVGKSTLIKACTNFSENIDFPVTDTARTTTYTTEYVFKDPFTVSKFAFAVAFKPESELKLKLEEASTRALRKAVQLALKPNEVIDSTIEEEVLKAFVTDPERLFKNEYIFGKYYGKNHPKRYDDTKKEQIVWWEHLYNQIDQLMRLMFIEEGISLESEENWSRIEGIEEKLLELSKRSETQSASKLQNIIDNLMNTIRQRAELLCSELEADDLGKAFRNSTGSITGFFTREYDESNVERVITLFTSTQAKHFSRLLTPIVDHIRIEVPYNERFPEELRKQQIIITDTVGIEHAKTTDTRSIEGSTKYFFEQYNCITVVDDASKSMDSTTTNILRSLFGSAAKGKIFLTYTFYDKFDKKDFEDEADKDFELLGLQDAALRKIADELSYDNTNWMIEDLKERTIFLKDLVPGTRQIESIIKYFQKMVAHKAEMNDFKQIQPLNKNKPILGYNYKKLALVFAQTQQEFLEQQRQIYFQEYLHWKTAEALTWRLYSGSTYFIGSYKTLRPVDDFCDLLLHKLHHFLSNPAEENFVHKNDRIENLSEKVKDWLKELVGDSVKKMSNKEFVGRYHEFWRIAYNEHGFGSDLRRRKIIMEVFNKVLPPLQMDASNNADIWIDALENMIEEAIEKMGGVKQTLELKRKYDQNPLYRIKRSIEREIYESNDILSADKPSTDEWTVKNCKGEWSEIRFGTLAEHPQFFDFVEEGAAKLEASSGYSRVIMVFANPLKVERKYNIQKLGKVTVIIVNENEIDNFSILKYVL